MILAKEFEGELWIKASDHYDEVNRSVDAERESCLEACRMYVDLNEPQDGFQNGVECCIAVIKHKDDLDVRARIKAKKEWVGLTDKERNACLVEADPCEALLEHEAWQLMRDIEAKLKEKNT